MPICFHGPNASPTMGFLRIPPGKRLEKMFGDLEEFLSVRINDQWRIVFQWIDDDVYKAQEGRKLPFA